MEAILSDKYEQVFRQAENIATNTFENIAKVSGEAIQIDGSSEKKFSRGMENIENISDKTFDNIGEAAENALTVDPKLAKNFEKGMKNAENTAKKSFKNIAKASSIAATTMIASAGLFVGGMVSVASSTAKIGDSIDKASQRANMGAESYQKWAYALDQSGVYAGRLEYANRNLMQGMIKAEQGNQKSIDTFYQLGLSVDDLATKSQEDIFAHTIKALADMEDETQRAAIGMEVLGARAYTDMIPLLNQGSESIEEAKLRAEELGLVMSQEAVDAAAEFSDKMSDVRSSLGALKLSLGQALIPIILVFLNLILDYMPKVHEAFARVIPIITSIFESLMPPILQLISSILPVLARLFMDLMPILYVLANDLFPILITVIILLISPLKIIINSILPIVIKLITFLSETVIPIFIEILQFLGENVLPPLTVAFEIAFNLISTIVSGVFNYLTVVIEMWQGILGGLIDFIAGIFTGDWERVWQGVSDIFGSIMNGLINLAKVPLNIIIGLVNSLIGSLNRISFSMPFSDKEIGVNIAKIPMLAKGSNYSPETFIAGEAGAELITGSKGKKVFTALETGNIMKNLGTVASLGTVDNKLQEVITHPETNISNVSNTKNLKAVSYPISSEQPITINYNPNITIDGYNGNKNDITELLNKALEENKNSLAYLVEDIINKNKNRNERLSNA
jgi:hypothetical protein